MKGKWICFSLWLFCGCFIFGGCHLGKAESAALFSWDGAAVEEPERIFRVMQAQELNTVYQSFPRDLKRESLVAFFEEAEKRGYEVYYLTGDPRWALPEGEDGFYTAIDRAVEMNESLQGKKLRGILFDVEPYTLKEWKEDAQALMASYVEAVRGAYAEAQKCGLQLILCIPYFYDSQGFAKELQTLIRDGCDQVAVMNYYRGKEKEHLETEAFWAEKYEKELITIYEFQPPGVHGLTEKNTYYHEGPEAARDQFELLRQAFPKLKLSLALHDFTALEEVLSGRFSK